MFFKPQLRWVTLLATGLLAASAALAQGFKLGELTIDRPYTHPTGPGMKTGGAYLKLVTNTGKVDDQLIAASSPVAARVELHRMEMQGDVMRMREVSAIALPAGTKVDMSRGAKAGFHLMLIDLKQPLKEGEQFPLKLRFKNAGEIEVQVKVDKREAGGSAAAGHKH